MSTREKLIQARISMLALADELQNISRACKLAGAPTSLDRSTSRADDVNVETDRYLYPLIRPERQAAPGIPAPRDAQTVRPSDRPTVLRYSASPSSGNGLGAAPAPGTAASTGGGGGVNPSGGSISMS